MDVDAVQFSKFGIKAKVRLADEPETEGFVCGITSSCDFGGAFTVVYAVQWLSPPDSEKRFASLFGGTRTRSYDESKLVALED